MITPSIFLPRRGLPRGVSRGWTGSFLTICGKFIEELPQLVPFKSHSVDLVALCEVLTSQVLVFLSKPGNLVFEGIRTGAGSVRLIP